MSMSTQARGTAKASSFSKYVTQVGGASLFRKGLLIEAAKLNSESADLLQRVVNTRERCCLPVDGNIMICEMVAVIDHWDRHRYGTMVDLKDFFQSITDAEVARAVGEVVKAAAKKATKKKIY